MTEIYVAGTVEEQADHHLALQAALIPIRWMQSFNPAILLGENMGNYGFSGSAPEIGCLVNAFQRLSPKLLSTFSVKDLNIITEQANKAQGVLKPIVEMSKHKSGVSRGRVTRMEEMEAMCKASLPIVQDYAERSVFVRGQRKEMEDLQRKMQGIAAELEETNKQSAGMLAKTTKKVESVVNEAEMKFRQQSESQLQVLAQTSVKKQSFFFYKEAESHQDAAYGWCVAAVVAAGLFLLYAFYGGNWNIVNWSEINDMDWTPKSTYLIARAAITRALIFAVLGYALFFCAKNYAAHRHNAVVNRHRQNALSTYRTLMRANKEPGNADIVLTQAARFIYTPQDSGYAHGGGTEGGNVSVLETVRHTAVDAVGKPSENK